MMLFTYGVYPSHKVSELLPALDGPGGALCGYIQAHAFLASGKQAADEAKKKAEEAKVSPVWDMTMVWEHEWRKNRACIPDDSISESISDDIIILMSCPLKTCK
jgi:hypothetical protein